VANLSCRIPVSVSVVVPVYNSEWNLPSLVSRIRAVFESMGCPFELILIDDGSRDGSWTAICDLAEKSNEIHGIRLMRNFGQHNALLCGIREAKYEVVVTLDDDLQHPPEEIPKLLETLAEGYDVVYGIPDTLQHGVLRDLASWFTKLALKTVMGADIARKVSAFRVFRTQVRDAYSNCQSPFVSVDVLLTWGTNRFSAVRVRHNPRSAGESNYTFRKLVVHALNMMTGFSTVPLQIASIVGFAFTLFGIGVLVYVLGRYLIEGVAVAGFAFLASIIAIFSGAQLFAIGVIGEYLARLHFRMMDRPTYVISQEVTSGKESK
jgi:glycosyltransferase involved in cell wall biosynthesis